MNKIKPHDLLMDIYGFVKIESSYIGKGTNSAIISITLACPSASLNLLITGYLWRTHCDPMSKLG